MSGIFCAVSKSIRGMERCWSCLVNERLHFSVFRLHHSTMYVGAACCYGQSSVVCRSVCLSVMIVHLAKTELN